MNWHRVFFLYFAGLAFDDWDLEYYTQLFQEKIRRNPTSVECFDLAQSNRLDYYCGWILVSVTWKLHRFQDKHRFMNSSGFGLSGTTSFIEAVGYRLERANDCWDNILLKGWVWAIQTLFYFDTSTIFNLLQIFYSFGAQNDLNLSICLKHIPVNHFSLHKCMKSVENVSLHSWKHTNFNLLRSFVSDYLLALP